MDSVFFQTLLSRASQDDGWLATVSDAPLPPHFIGGASVAHNALAPLAPETPISGRAVTTAAFKAYHWSSPPKHDFVCNSHAHYISDVLIINTKF
ncbi:hypothetical protein EVAR_57568_1 [Eumeta japonica]|uniref:Uncharacterized protein n=1 Tax=Eumeta variegata TaxID=151549 RepID=A0A4C1Z3W6_EUMVA|nr:hypothetical protein EVAR_57568_1 [Eumeta japonica]